TVGIHPHGESSDVDMAVVARFSREDFGIVRKFEGTDGLGPVVAKNSERFSGFVGELAPEVTGVEIPLSVGADGHGVQRVVVVLPVESGQENLAFVLCLIKF